MTLLTVTDISHHYKHANVSGKNQLQSVLKDVSLTLKSGETVALLGRSGCGKSTLARLLVGLEFPTQGYVSWQGNLSHGSIVQSKSLPPRYSNGVSGFGQRSEPSQNRT